MSCCQKKGTPPASTILTFTKRYEGNPNGTINSQRIYFYTPGTQTVLLDATTDANGEIVLPQNLVNQTFDIYTENLGLDANAVLPWVRHSFEGDLSYTNDNYTITGSTTFVVYDGYPT